MNRLATIVLSLIVICTVLAFGQNIWLNEIHYDNTGTDAGEFVEVVAPSSFSDLPNVTITLYNGNGGAPYGSETLDNFAVGATSFGFTLYSFDYPVNGIQNGAPDGICISYGVTVIQFLSYEGTFAGVGGPADGLTSTDIGVSETGSEPIGQSLQLVGNGTQYSDFTWSGPATNTEGQPNSDGVTDQNLPVALISFTASAGNNLVTLKWITASEQENVGFKIMRSTAEEGNYSLLSSYETNPELEGQFNSNVQTKYKFMDQTVVNNQTYWYKLVDVDVNGVQTEHGPMSATPHAVGGDITTINIIPAGTFELHPNYPNPFNPKTTLRFDIPALSGGESMVEMTIYNAQGQKVKTLFKGILTPGTHELSWESDSDTGVTVSSGMYYAVLKMENLVRTSKMLLIK